MSFELNTQILSVEQIEGFTDEQIKERIRQRVRQAQSAFVEVARLIMVVKKRYEARGKPFKPYVIFKDVMPKGSLSNAVTNSLVWENYVEAGHLSEADFEELRFEQVLDLGRAFKKAGWDPLQTVRRTVLGINHGNDSSVRGKRFEDYIFIFLKAKYGRLAWVPSGALKQQERGLDFIGDFHDSERGLTRRLGVQVKFHNTNATPTDLEWLQFLAGCFVRRINEALFITTGRLTSNQLREAGEAGIQVLQGRDEITRMAKQFDLPACPDF